MIKVSYSKLPHAIFFFVCFSFLFYEPVLAQQRLNLTDALQLLKENNIDIRQHQYQSAIARQDLKDAKNALLPKLALGVNHNYNYGLTFDQIAGQLITGNRWTNSANANLNTQAVIFQGFALRNQIRDALLNLESNFEQERTLNRSLHLQLLQLFFTAITNEALYSSSLKQLAFSQEQLQLQLEELNLGKKTLVDISLAESQVAIDEFNVLNSKNNNQEALIHLKQLLHIPYTDSIKLDITDKLTSNLLNIDTSFKLNLSSNRNPFILQAEIQKRRAELGVKAAKNSYLPTLSFSGGYGTNYSSERRDAITGLYLPFEDQVGLNRSLYLGLTLTAPLLDGFRVRSAKNKANLQLLIQAGEVDKVTAEQDKIHLLAIQELRRAEEEHRVSQKQFESLKTALEAMSDRYALGVASSIEYTKALLDHNLAELRVIASKYTLIYAREVITILQSPE